MNAGLSQSRTAIIHFAITQRPEQKPLWRLTGIQRELCRDGVAGRWQGP